MSLPRWRRWGLAQAPRRANSCIRNQMHTAAMFDACLYFNTAALARRLERLWAEAFAPFDPTPPRPSCCRRSCVSGAAAGPAGQGHGDLAAHGPRALDGLAAKGLVTRSPRQPILRDRAAPHARGRALQVCAGRSQRSRHRAAARRAERCHLRHHRRPDSQRAPGARLSAPPALRPSHTKPRPFTACR